MTWAAALVARLTASTLISDATVINATTRVWTPRAVAARLWAASED